MTWLWGGFAVDNPTLNRFFSLHYLLPFIIVGRGDAARRGAAPLGSNNPLGIDPKGPQDTVPFHPYYTMKDGFGAQLLPDRLRHLRVLLPNVLGEADNYVPANPLVTPNEIVPEWYLLPFYAILRAVPDKLGGVLCMFGAIAVLFFVPWLDTCRCGPARSGRSTSGSCSAAADRLIVLGICGAHPPGGLVCTVVRVGTIYYFFHFLVLLPVLGKIERPLPLPPSIADAVLQEKVAGHPCARSDEFMMRAIALAALTAGAVAIAAEVGRASAAHALALQGPFGTYDRAAAQRGFQVYKEVCSACHSLSLLSYRNLTEFGLTEDQVKGIAAEFQVPDIGDDGSAIERPARPSDRFKKPFPNELAAAAANGGKRAARPQSSSSRRAKAGRTTPRASDRLRAVRQAHAGPGQGVRRHQGRQLQPLFPGPQDRHAAAAQRRPGEAYIERRPSDARADVDRLSFEFLAWARSRISRRAIAPVSGFVLFLLALAGPDVRRETAGLGRQALTGRERPKTKKPRLPRLFCWSAVCRSGAGDASAGDAAPIAGGLPCGDCSHWPSP